MTTRTAFESGRYILQFDLGGCYVKNQSNTVTVSLGNYVESITLSRYDPLLTYTREVTISAPDNINLIFNHAGGDNVGLILDNVKLYSSVVPEPFTMSLMGLGLLGFGIIKKKRR